MNAIQNWIGALPAGWTGGEATTKWWRGEYVHLYSLRKPCAQCGRDMCIDVTKAALKGEAKNAGLKLQRCQECRTASKKAARSRPKVEGTAGDVQAPADEVEALRTANDTMRKEIDGAYAHIRELSARLSRYELQPALETMAQQQPFKFPWQS